MLARLVEMQANQYMRPPAPVTVANPTAPPSTIRVHKPDLFSGSEPRKLRPFLTKCQMAFRLDPRAFRNDTTCILYAGSHLDGPALNWFESMQTFNPDAEALTKWEEFSKALQQEFGEPFPHFAAQHRLYRLKMTSDSHITEFNSEFMQDASTSRLCSIAQAMLYFEGLPRRLQDEIVRKGRPLEFEGLRDLATRLDQTYWQQRANWKWREQTKEPTKTSAAQPERTAPAAASTKSNTQSNTTSARPGGSQMTDEEKKKLREHRMANGLCYRCGQKGHLRADCPRGQPSGGSVAKAATLAHEPGPSPAFRMFEAPEEPKNM